LGWPISEPHTHHNYNDDNYDYNNSCANDHNYINNDEHNNYYFYDDNRFTNNDNYDGCPNLYLAAVSS
jgi:hypothetical protein